MQPKNMSAHQRVKYEPTHVQKQLKCRLFGKTFRSVVAAARYYKLSPSTAYEYHHNHLHRETFPNRKRWDKWRKTYETIQKL